MYWQEWADVIPAEELQLLDRGRRQEIEQPLIDLGYLSGASDFRLNDSSFQQQFTSAIQHFRSDYFSCGLLLDSHQQLLKLPAYELNSLELNLLHMLTGLDGALNVPEIPFNGQRNLWARVVHYRLMVLGVFSEMVDVPFGVNAKAAISKVGKWIGMENKSALEIINETGHIPKLTAELLATDALRKHVVVFKYENPRVALEVLSEVAEEQEEDDDEVQLIALESEIQKELTELDAHIFSKEEAEWEKMNNKNKGKQRRIKRIEARMTRILKEEQKLLTGSLTIEQSLRNRLNQREEQLSILTKELQKSTSQINKQKDKIKIQNSSAKKTLEKKEKECKNLKKEVSEPSDIPTVLGLLVQSNQNNSIRKQNIKHLQQQGNKKQIVKKFKEDIRKEEQLISSLQIKIQRIKKIQKLEEEISILKKETFSFDIEKQKLALLESDERKIKSLSQHVQKVIKTDKELLTKTQQDRQLKMGQQQLQLADLNRRLKRLREKVNGLSYRFKAKLQRSLDQDYYQEIRQKIFRDRRTDYLAEVAEDPFNLFLIRLLQVRQWMNGYYYGRLDSQPGGRTFQSIVEFTEGEDSSKLRLKYILTKLGKDQKGFWLLNAQYYFERVVALDTEPGPDSTAELISAYENEIEYDNSIYNNKNTKEAWQSYTEELNQGLDGSEHSIRRFYYGVKSMARNIGRVLKRLMLFLIRGAKVVLRILKNFIKLIYKEIREGTRNFFDGMSFLFSKRSIATMDLNGTPIVSRYDFDFDSTVIIPNGVAAETIQSHIQTCLIRTSNLHFSMRLCGKILKWVITLATGSLTWPRLALKIAFYFKRLIVEYFKERKKNLKKRKSTLSTE